MNANERIIYRPENSQRGQIIKTLVSGFKNQKMESIILTIDNPNEYEVKFYNHPGQEFILLLEGSMRYHYKDEEFTLYEGDSLYFNAENMHGPLPIDGQRAKYLSVLLA